MGKYKCVAYKAVRLVGYLYAVLVLKLTKTDINGHYNVVQLAYIMKTDFVGIIIRSLGSTHESFFFFFFMIMGSLGVLMKTRFWK